MNKPHQSALEVEQLLRAAGVDIRPLGASRRAPTSRARRVLRRVRIALLRVILCAAVALWLSYALSLRQAGDLIDPPNALHRLPWFGAVDPRFGIEEAYRAPRQAATVPIGWERIPFFWSEVQKGGPDSWNAFAMSHDQYIDQEVKSGRQVVGLLINTPSWAATQPALHGASPPKGLYLPVNDPGNTWARFVSAITKRYAGRINDWIIWNEVNIPAGHWKTWGGTTADYVRLLKVAYLAAKAANSQARIILAGDPYWYDHGAFFRDLLRLLSRDPTARAHHYYFDAVNLHLYSRPADTVAVVDWYRATMARMGVTKPIWIAETNAVPYDDTVRLYPRGGFRVTTDQQASFVIQEFALGLAAGVQRIEINRMLDGADFQAGGEPFGLVRNDGTVRPAFDAYRTAAAIFAGVTHGTIAVNTTTGVYAVTLYRPGAVITVLWDQHPTASSATIAVQRGVQYYDKFGQALQFTARDGHALLPLQGSTGNTNSGDPRDYVLGGNPVLVVQPA